MVEEPIALPVEGTDAAILAFIDDVIDAAGLHMTLRDTLKRYAGCVHWHVKPKGASAAGTLEITFWPAERRAWFSIQQRRQAPWIAGAIERVRAALAQRLNTGDEQ